MFNQFQGETPQITSHKFQVTLQWLRTLGQLGQLDQLDQLVGGLEHEFYFPIYWE